jgi:hypothetical protein
MFQRLDADAIPRDRWGRPLIVPVGGGKPIPYTRVSTLAKALDDKTALTKWKQRQTAIGLAARPDLMARVGVQSDDKRAMDEIIEEAMTAAESQRAANIGTALHALTEHVDAGTMPDHIPDEMWGDLHAYEEAMRGITKIAAELFVVCDELQAAGSFDRLVEVPGVGTIVADLKTGQNEPSYPHGVAQQIAIYAHGALYHPDEGRVATLADVGVRTDVGLMIHLPAGQGRCDLYLIDLDHGWALAQAAVAVRAAYKVKALTHYTSPATATA